ncbi:MAG: DNA recombination protein RmuC [Candidatus Melainabacteria bacterium]|nr:DNA recombination protein RmuC [Candidatus Melainabacteria bacterium]
MDVLNYLVFGLLAILIFFVLFALNKINETLNQKLSEVKDDFTKHLTSSHNTLNTVTENVSELKSAAQNILEVGKDIQSLQDILKPPKLRGMLGEIFLEQILEQILPPQHYTIFYKFQTGNIVDAVVKLKDSQMLCIDAKFPLDSIREYIKNDNNKNSDEIPSQFVRDVKRHIDAISSKYILPKEGTLDFALMYIPAENVYYQIILRDDKIMNYAREKHIIPVSPLSLYSYLSTILIGLKGMGVEKNAKQILGKIGDLRNSLDVFSVEFNTLGSHLNNARAKYDLAREKVINLSEKLKNIDVSRYEEQ